MRYRAFVVASTNRLPASGQEIQTRLPLCLDSFRILLGKNVPAVQAPVVCSFHLKKMESA